MSGTDAAPGMWLRVRYAMSGTESEYRATRWLRVRTTKSQPHFGLHPEIIDGISRFQSSLSESRVGFSLRLRGAGSWVLGCAYGRIAVLYAARAHTVLTVLYGAGSLVAAHGTDGVIRGRQSRRCTRGSLVARPSCSTWA
eukprot:2624399-Rhodomonas_salina.3